MACKIDDVLGAVDARTKVLELQREWERSRAFLAQLEADINESAAGGEKTAVQPTACTEPVLGDSADFGDLNPPRYAVTLSSDISNAGDRSGSQSGSSCRRVTVEGIPVMSQVRRPSVSQINMKFQPSDEYSVERVFVEEMLSSSLSTWRPGLLQSRQPKQPQLQRSMSLRQKGMPPVHRARLLRAGTFGDVPMPYGQDPCHVERSAPASGTPAPIPVSTAHTVHDGPAFTTTRRFSMDHDQLYVSSALVPTTLGACAQRRITIGCGEAAGGRLGASGGTGSGKADNGVAHGFRTMEPFRTMSDAGEGACGNPTNANNPSAEIDISGSGSSGSSAPSDLLSNGGTSATAPSIPPIRGQCDPPGGHPPGLHNPAPLPPPLRPLQTAAAVLTTNTKGAPGGPSDGLRLPMPSSLRCLSFKSSPTESSTGSGCGVADGRSTPSGVPESDCADAALVPSATMSLSPRANQPRAIFGQPRPWQREAQQQPSGALSSSVDSGLPCLPYEAVTPQRYFRFLSMPRSHKEGVPAPGQLHPMQRYQGTDEGPLTQAFLAANPPCHLRAKSMGSLRLKGIPEEGAAGVMTRRPWGPQSESGVPQPSSHSGRFTGRLVHEVVVPSYANNAPSCISGSGAQMGSRRLSRRSWGMDAFESISENNK